MRSHRPEWLPRPRQSTRALGSGRTIGAIGRRACRRRRPPGSRGPIVALLGEKPGDGDSEDRGRAVLLAESIGDGIPSRGGTGQRRVDQKLIWKPVALYTGAQLEPVESRHLYVNDCQGRPLSADRLPCLNAIRGFKNDIPHVFKCQPRQGPHILVVVHH